jgi:hypothetical protein
MGFYLKSNSQRGTSSILADIHVPFGSKGPCSSKSRRRRLKPGWWVLYVYVEMEVHVRNIFVCSCMF